MLAVSKQRLYLAKARLVHWEKFV